jgi:hypothetical protein
MDFDEGAHNVVIIFDKLIHAVVYQYWQLTMDILCPTTVQKTM